MPCRMQDGCKRKAVRLARACLGSVRQTHHHRARLYERDERGQKESWVLAKRSKSRNASAECSFCVSEKLAGVRLVPFFPLCALCLRAMRNDERV